MTLNVTCTNIFVHAISHSMQLDSVHLVSYIDDIFPFSVFRKQLKTPTCACGMHKHTMDMYVH